MFKYLNKYGNTKTEDELNRIGVFIKDYSVSADIRLLYIFNEISKKYGYSFYIIEGKDLLTVEKDLLNNKFFFDTIIIQRNALDQNTDVKSDLFDLIVKYSKKNKIKIVYEIDDDLLNMDKSNPGHTYYMSIKSKMEYLIKNSDVVTVSTKTLQKTLYPLNKNIIVIPNRLIDSWFDFVPYKKFKNKNQIIIGYMGTIYHSWDLPLLETAINNVKKYFLKKNKEVVFELVGGTNQDLKWAKKIDVPPEKNRYIKFVPWLKSIANWDIAVAPLEKSAINYNKSELKYLEYTGLNVPGIYSAIGPYKEKVVHNNTGILIKNNTPEEWERNIIRLIEDEELQKNILKNSKKDIENNYLINFSINQWLDILTEDYNIEKNSSNKYQSTIQNIKNKYLNTSEKLNILEITPQNNQINPSQTLTKENWKYEKIFFEKNIENNYIMYLDKLKTIKNNSINIIISLEFFKIIPFFWLLLTEYERILKENGQLFITFSNSNQPIKLTQNGIGVFTKNNNLKIIKLEEKNGKTCIILKKIK